MGCALHQCTLLKQLLTEAHDQHATRRHNISQTKLFGHKNARQFTVFVEVVRIEISSFGAFSRRITFNEVPVEYGYMKVREGNPY